MSLFARLAASPRWDDLRYRVPTRVHWPLEGVVIAADRASYRAWLRARRWDPRAGGNGREAVIRVRALGGAPVVLREDTADAWALSSALLPPYHFPAGGLVPRDARLAFDLGANIGLTMADLAQRLPRARIVGVEMASGNAAACRRNVATWGDRCVVVEAAVWPRDGEVRFDGDSSDEVSFRVGDGVAPGGEPAGLAVRAVSIGALLAEHAAEGEMVDFLKIDVEGAEAGLLTEETGWAQRVRVLSVEVHEPYAVERCLGDLEALGFRAYRDPRFRGRPGEGMPPVIGVR